MSFTSNSTGGEFKHKLTIEELPNHKHCILDQIADAGTGLNGDSKSNTSYTKATERADKTKQYWYGYTYPSGDDKSHNNVQPFIVTFFWKRVN